MSVTVKYPQKSVKKITVSKEVKNIKVSSDLVKLLVLPSIFK